MKSSPRPTDARPLRHSARLALLAFALSVTACATAQNELEHLINAPRVTRPSVNLNGHVPPTEAVASDRDELLAVLDSMYKHYDKRARRTTSAARSFAIGALVIGTIGAISPAIIDGDRAERKLSQAASALTALLGGIATEYQMARKSESYRACVATLYHAVSDVRIRYSNATLPATDSTWFRYIIFKDSVDRAMRLTCE